MGGAKPKSGGKQSGGGFKWEDDSASQSQLPRQFVPVDYTPEEMQSGSEYTSGLSEKEREDQRKAALKAFADSIPVEK